MAQAAALVMIDCAIWDLDWVSTIINWLDVIARLPPEPHKVREVLYTSIQRLVEIQLLVDGAAWIRLPGKNCHCSIAETLASLKKAVEALEAHAIRYSSRSRTYRIIDGIVELNNTNNIAKSVQALAELVIHQLAMGQHVHSNPFAECDLTKLNCDHGGPQGRAMTMFLRYARSEDNLFSSRNAKQLAMEERPNLKGHFPVISPQFTKQHITEKRCGRATGTIASSAIPRPKMCVVDVERLVELTWKGSDQVKHLATHAPVRATEISKTGVITCGGVAVLLQILDQGPSEAKGDAVAALNELAQDEWILQSIAAAGGISLLIDLMQNSRRVIDKLTAVQILCRMSKAEITRAGGLQALIDLTHGGSPEESMGAANALGELLLSGSEREVEYGLRALQLLAREDTCVANAIAEAGGISKLVLLLKTGSMRCKELAADALLLVATSKNRRGMVRACLGGIQAVLDLRAQGSPVAKTNALAVLLLLARENETRQQILKLADDDGDQALRMLRMQDHHARGAQVRPIP